MGKLLNVSIQFGSSHIFLVAWPELPVRGLAQRLLSSCGIAMNPDIVELHLDHPGVVLPSTLSLGNVLARWRRPYDEPEVVRLKCVVQRPPLGKASRRPGCTWGKRVDARGPPLHTVRCVTGRALAAMAMAPGRARLLAEAEAATELCLLPYTFTSWNDACDSSLMEVVVRLARDLLPEKPAASEAVFQACSDLLDLPTELGPCGQLYAGMCVLQLHTCLLAVCHPGGVGSFPGSPPGSTSAGPAPPESPDDVRGGCTDLASAATSSSSSSGQYGTAGAGRAAVLHASLKEGGGIGRAGKAERQREAALSAQLRLLAKAAGRVGWVLQQLSCYGSEVCNMLLSYTPAQASTPAAEVQPSMAGSEGQNGAVAGKTQAGAGRDLRVQVAEALEPYAAMQLLDAFGRLVDAGGPHTGPVPALLPPGTLPSGWEAHRSLFHAILELCEQAGVGASSAPGSDDDSVDDMEVDWEAGAVYGLGSGSDGQLAAAGVNGGDGGAGPSPSSPAPAAPTLLELPLLARTLDALLQLHAQAHVGCSGGGSSGSGSGGSGGGATAAAPAGTVRPGRHGAPGDDSGESSSDDGSILVTGGGGACPRAPAFSQLPPCLDWLQDVTAVLEAACDVYSLAGGSDAETEADTMAELSQPQPLGVGMVAFASGEGGWAQVPAQVMQTPAAAAASSGPLHAGSAAAAAAPSSDPDASASGSSSSGNGSSSSTATAPHPPTPGEGAQSGAACAAGSSASGSGSLLLGSSESGSSPQAPSTPQSGGGGSSGAASSSGVPFATAPSPSGLGTGAACPPTAVEDGGGNVASEPTALAATAAASTTAPSSPAAPATPPPHAPLAGLLAAAPSPAAAVAATAGGKGGAAAAASPVAAAAAAAAAAATASALPSISTRALILDALLRAFQCRCLVEQVLAGGTRSGALCERSVWRHPLLAGCAPAAAYQRQALENLLTPLSYVYEEDDYDAPLLSVCRSDLLGTSMSELMQYDGYSLESEGICISFEDEEAHGDGVLREWLTEVAAAVFDPNAGLFRLCEGDVRALHLSPAGCHQERHLELLSFAGRIIGLAMRARVPLGFHLSSVLYKMLQHPGRAGRARLGWSDLAQLEPRVAATCTQIAAASDVEALGLTFVASCGHLGLAHEVSLLPGGRGEHEAVTAANRRDFLDRLVRFYCTWGCSSEHGAKPETQDKAEAAGEAEGVVSASGGDGGGCSWDECPLDAVEALAQGLADALVFTDEDGVGALAERLRPISAAAFNSRLGGETGRMDAAAWRSHTSATAFKTDRETAALEAFWSVVGELEAEEQRRLLQFWTGISHLPAGGFKNLSQQLQLVPAKPIGDGSGWDAGSGSDAQPGSGSGSASGAGSGSGTSTGMDTGSGSRSRSGSDGGASASSLGLEAVMPGPGEEGESLRQRSGAEAGPSGSGTGSFGGAEASVPQAPESALTSVLANAAAARGSGSGPSASGASSGGASVMGSEVPDLIESRTSSSASSSGANGSYPGTSSEGGAGGAVRGAGTSGGRGGGGGSEGGVSAGCTGPVLLSAHTCFFQLRLPLLGDPAAMRAAMVESLANMGAFWNE